VNSRPEALPSASVVVTVTTGWDATFRCLMAVAQHSSGVARETIVVDDASTDETRQALPLLEGLRVLRNEREAGMLAACEQAAEVAQGDVLVFLDRDATVGPGWLAALAARFGDPEVAAACPAEEGLAGAFLAVRSSDYRRAGGFDPGRADGAEALLQALAGDGRRIELVQDLPVTLARAAAPTAPAPPAPAPRAPVTVAVAVRDGAGTLSACLDGIARSLGPDDEIVIADASSNDATLEAAYAFAARHARRTRVLVGAPALALAAQEALRAADRPMVLLVRPDVEVPPRFVDAAASLLAGEPASTALALELPRGGFCLLGPSAVMRAASRAGAEALLSDDAVELARRFQEIGTTVAVVPTA
jgi:GT2 family glycosyltransferase